jgi:hypothetical protein
VFCFSYWMAIFQIIILALAYTDSIRRRKFGLFASFFSERY